jgi:hypothetical protein
MLRVAGAIQSRQRDGPSAPEMVRMETVGGDSGVARHELRRILAVGTRHLTAQIRRRDESQADIRSSPADQHRCLPRP